MPGNITCAGVAVRCTGRTRLESILPVKEHQIDQRRATGFTQKLFAPLVLSGKQDLLV